MEQAEKWEVWISSNLDGSPRQSWSENRSWYEAVCDIAAIDNFCSRTSWSCLLLEKGVSKGLNTVSYKSSPTFRGDSPARRWIDASHKDGGIFFARVKHWYQVLLRIRNLHLCHKAIAFKLMQYSICLAHFMTMTSIFKATWWRSEISTLSNWFYIGRP